MAITDPKVVEIRELRFRPANSNDRARAGLEHDFKDVPPCSFAKDDGISPYIGSDSKIGDFPDTPAAHVALHEDIPDVKQDVAGPATSFGSKLLRSGFALSVFLHAVAALGITFATIGLPDDSALEGETVIAVEFFSETNSDVTTVKQQVEQEGEEIEQPVVEKAEIKPEPVKEPEKVEKPAEEKPLEQAKVPEPVKESEKVEEPVVTTDQPEVLATEQPSTFAVEQAAKQILKTSEIAPLPDKLPDLLVAPVVEKKPETKLAQPLAHPVSKPRVVQKVAEVKPVEKPVEKKEEPKPVEKKPEPKKEELKKPEPKPKKKAEEKPAKKKKTVQRDGNADSDNVKGRDTAKKKGKSSQNASDGGSNNRQIGNAAVSNYNGLVQRKLERAKRRVRVSGKGSATVSFTVAANGSVTGLRIGTSSGKPAVDKAALDVVRKASPFPKFPPEEKRKSRTMTVPMTFR
jgi:periplasmic protein TonB